MVQTPLREKALEKAESAPSETTEVNGKRDDLNTLRKIQGFPAGEEGHLLELSDPPFFTSYPNPHITEFLQRLGKRFDSQAPYHCEPFVGDVSEGKNDPIYNAHTFHTKVPYKAVVKFVEHYTRPGDVVLDAFCGSGMTGVACRVSGRNAILVDLSPLATFLAHNFAHNLFSLPYSKVEKVYDQIYDKLSAECASFYRTRHGEGMAEISGVVWTVIAKCPYCGGEINLWTSTVSRRRVEDEFTCESCGASVSINSIERLPDSRGQKEAPALIKYRYAGKKLEKNPDDHDLRLLKQIDTSEIPYWFPSYPMMFKGERWGDTWRAGVHAGMTRVEDFYTKRNLWTLAALHHIIDQIPTKDIRLFFMFIFTSLNPSLVSKLTRYNFGKRGDGPLSGTLYVPSFRMERNVIEIFKKKFEDVSSLLNPRGSTGEVIVSTQSATDLSNILENSVDYVFVDPPFGSNLMYSELSFIWESWLKVFTNVRDEAIMNDSQGKGLSEYRSLMFNSFREMYRVLKPNRWITVEFHNSQASVWNAIQDSLSRAGFIVAQVVIFDKKQGSFKQVTAAGAVKNDLIISAYKPAQDFTQRFLKYSGQGLEDDFIRQHLERLPIERNIERTDKMLFSKMLAYYIQHGYEIRLNAQQFYSMLRDNFEEKDGYWFLESQLDQYDVKVKKRPIVSAQTSLFISDERSAIQWLNWFLESPRSYDAIYVEFVKALMTQEEEVPELKNLLDDNFVADGGKYRKPAPTEREGVEDRREKRLLKYFAQYLEQARAGRMIVAPRREAILAGLTECYREKRFQDILSISRKLPSHVIENSSEILDLIEVARAKTAG